MARHSGRAHVTTLCTWTNCGRPTRDGALVCEESLDDLAAGLRALLPSTSDRPDQLSTARLTVTAGGVVFGWCPLPRPMAVVPGLWDELQATIVGDRGIDYRALGGGKGASGSEGEGVVATGISLNERASEVSSLLRAWLRHLVLICQDHRLDHLAPAEWQPRSTHLVPAMAEWLTWRIDAMAWNPEAAAAAEQVDRIIDQARWAIDRPESRQQLGLCPVEGCDGHVSAVHGAAFAICGKCRGQVEAQPLRDRVLAEADGQVMTAAQFADFATRYGSNASPETVRERTRKALSKWAQRDQILPAGYVTPSG